LNEIDALRTREAQARSALRLFDDDMQALASHNVDVVRESYQLGRATLIDVLAETRRLLDVEAAYGDALLDFVEARVQLAAALGER
jgi:outer membrane protein TolC